MHPWNVSIEGVEYRPKVNPSTAKFNNLKFNPLEVVSRYRDPQEGENSSYLFNLIPNICKMLMVNPFKSEFTIVIFIYHKPRIAVAILDL